MPESSHGSAAVKYSDVERHVFKTAGARSLFKELVPKLAHEILGNADSEQSMHPTNAMEDHHQLHSLSFMPLLSRVDRLDSVIKDVEKKKKKQEESSMWSNGTRRLVARRNSRKGMPLIVATRETNAKGSLMDRIRSLEDRLLQLSREIDQASSKASSSSSTQSTSLWTTSSTSCAQLKSEIPISSYPTFHIAHESRLPCHEYFQKNPRGPQPRMKNPENGMQQKEGKDYAVEKECINGKKKKKSPCWQRMKLLGC
ncbi:hypothetical protein POM88_049812 [Heracleum sosnowskyi]|uniref:Uncharacterized protein n=1 Tax=Heracleum sosnowskyi TaxID=360622 RepID=A0AAD8GXK2_9APIA|nr:hypothetical protein POM88_049812 [Heracleum sosnowskyi]